MTWHLPLEARQRIGRAVLAALDRGVPWKTLEQTHRRSRRTLWRWAQLEMSQMSHRGAGRSSEAIDMMPAPVLASGKDP